MHHRQQQLGHRGLSRLLIRIGAAIVFLLAIALPAAALEVRGIARVVDGDTLNIEGLGVRLHGIDAPETAQTCKNATGLDYACGEAATRRLKALADSREVICTGKEFDQYKRFVGICLVSAVELNRTMVIEGHAWAFIRFSQDYAAVERDARVAKLGVFATENTAPWDFRSGAWQTAAQTGRSADGRQCPIKGNVSRNGDRIYHMPWQKDYARVRIEAHPEKRWFCDENEATAAGWRKAAR